MEAVYERTAADIMTKDVLAVRADWSIERLADFLVEHHISGAPVLAEGGYVLIGAVSMTDLVRFSSLPQREPSSHRASSYYLESSELLYADEELESFRVDEDSSTLVRDIMTPAIFSVKEQATLSEVAATMVRGRIHRVFVTQKGRLVGVISALDILKAIVQDV